MQIHEKIKQARISANLTEEELAKKIGVKRSTYQYWEKNTPAIGKIKRVAKALNLDEDYFLSKNDENIGKTSENILKEPAAEYRKKKTLPPGAKEITLDDYIAVLVNDKLFLQELLKTSLAAVLKGVSEVAEGQKILLAYQEGWINHFEGSAKLAKEQAEKTDSLVSKKKTGKAVL